MKHYLFFTVILITGILLSSCSNDFLDGNNKDMFILEDTLFINSQQDQGSISLDLGGIPESDYTIIMFPKFLSLSDMHGRTSSQVTIPFTIVKDFIPQVWQTYYNSIVLDVENTGLVYLTVVLDNYGSPVLQCSTDFLSFEYTFNQSFTISNISSGILKWKISGIPDWLTLSQTFGSLTTGSSVSLFAMLNTEKIFSNKEYSATLQIISNSVTGNMGLTIRVIPGKGFPDKITKIEGTVADAEYSHESGIMAILTRSPNSLIIKNTSTDVSSIIPLSKAPSCISISEDGTKALVGFTESSLAYIDIANLNITNEYNIDCIPSDVVLGGNGWAYITPVNGQWVNFRSFNLSTGEMFENSNSDLIFERTRVKKIPGKPTLVALSLATIFMFDISEGKASDQVSSYHADINNFLISSDGTKLYCWNKNVYQIPENDGLSHTGSPTLTGTFETPLYYLSGFDDCPAINSVFSFSSFLGYPPQMASLIEQYDLTSLKKTASFYVSPIEFHENGTTELYESNPKFIFANKQGTRLYAINNLKETLNREYWSIQEFKIEDKGR